MKIKTLASTLLLSTFLLGGHTTEAKTYTLDEVTIKQFDYTIRYGDGIYASQFDEGLILIGTRQVDDNGEYLTDENGWFITEYGYYNTKGELVIPVNAPAHAVQNYFSEGVVPVVVSEVEDSDEKMVAFMDTTGTLVTEAFLCNSASGFKDGIAQIYNENGSFFIDHDGNIVDTDYIAAIENSYNGELSAFSENIATIQMPSSVDHEREIIFIDKSGTELFRKTANACGAFRDGLAIIGYSDPKTYTNSGITSYSPYFMGEYMTFVDTTGKEFPEKYVGIRYFSEGLAAVQKTGDFDGDGTTESLWGYIDKTGTVVIDYQFDKPGYFSEGYAFVGKDETKGSVNTNTLYAVIDTSGNLLTDYIYHSPREFSDGLAYVGLLQEGSKYSSDCYYIDINGNIIIDFGELSADGFGSDFEDGTAFFVHNSYHSTAYIIRNPLLEDGYTPPETTTPPENTTPTTSSETVATPSTAKVMVNGAEVPFGAYNIDGYNYFKLTDIAYSIDGTEKQFNVGWDSSANAIDISLNQSHSTLGTELEANSGKNETADLFKSPIFCDGTQVSPTAYIINGSSYFQLNALIDIVGITVGWDGETSTITITT